MSNYTENKKKLDSIRNEYRTTGDVLFRTSLQVVIEQGQANFKDEEWYAEVVKETNDKHDKAEAQGKILVIGRSFDIAILECAKRIADIEPYFLMMYIQREVFLSNEGIDYQRAMELLKSCMYVIVDDVFETSEIRDTFLDDVGFEEDELEALGYGFLLDTIEEDDE